MAEPYKSKPTSINPLDYAGKDFLDFIHRLDLSVGAYFLNDPSKG